MELRDVRLADRYDLARSPVLLSGTQALVRACLMQRARDRAAGADTAGYVTGYRGSPLGAVDGTFLAARPALEAAPVRFEAGLNEDLAATALWGSQQAGLRGEGRHQGVFGLWYGKGPGVDRSGDVFRHANLAGTAPLGGVLAAMGDDHTCESSTTCHQSDFAMMDAMIPVLSPAGVQDLVDMMLMGWALSRSAGTWVGIKAMKDTIEATGVVDGDPHRLAIALPGDLGAFDPRVHIRLGDTPQEQEARLHGEKLPLAQRFAALNRLNRPVWNGRGERIGLVAAGKSWLDLESALGLLGIDAHAAERLGIATFKVGMTWPLAPDPLVDWAAGLERVVVVEEKRAIVETQLRDLLFDRTARPAVFGRRGPGGAALYRETLDLDAAMVAEGLAAVLADAGIHHPPMDRGRARLRALKVTEPPIAVRQPWFCAGCPHSTSTRVPEGARAYAGIGCHYMVQWMDRETEGFTHMGGEGANWIGEAPFSTRPHVFQNLGDGTYNHSGLMAIRAAVSAGTNITFKILYNDAVAMTGGQTHEGHLTPHRIAAELIAAGVRRVDCVYDPAEGVPEMPAGVALAPRAELDRVQRAIAQVPGTTAIVYVQTCATEKKRRRKRGAFPEAPARVFINSDVCEGCGDCGVQSNCVAVLPMDTPLGRKRQIDQSACTQDTSCLSGFCPSFVTVEGARPRAKAGNGFQVPELPEPALPALERPWNLLITGIGGTGVVTVGALISMAAHLEGRGASEMQMAGLAQKGGAVAIHCRLAPSPADIHAVRLATGEADALIGGDLVVAASPKVLSLTAGGRTRAVCSTEEVVSGQFTVDREFRVPGGRLRDALSARLGADALAMVDAVGLARAVLGNAIYANVLLLGAAWQAGLVPLSLEALQRAIELNGAGVEGNKRAFALGRLAVADPAAAAAAEGGAEAEAPVDPVAHRVAHLTAYQGPALARRYRAGVTRAEAAEQAAGVEGFAEAVAEGYHKLLAYKDEYEVARLHHQTTAAAIAEAFEGVEDGTAPRLRFHLAPPMLPGRDANGRPKKRAFGPWMMRVFGLLRHGKLLRGTVLDPFGHTAERRMERALIAEYEAGLKRWTETLSPATAPTATALARLPLEIRGFGPVKAKAAAEAAETRAALEAALANGDPAPLATAAE
ncbi:MAG: indolepyruvate ferredoxin oxidoreductase family protein [Pseudomonadota bacterium]